MVEAAVKRKAHKHCIGPPRVPNFVKALTLTLSVEGCTDLETIVQSFSPDDLSYDRERQLSDKP